MHTTVFDIQHPSLSRGKIFYRLAVAISVVVSFLSSKMITVPNLNGKLAFIEGCVHLSSARQCDDV